MKRIFKSLFMLLAVSLVLPATALAADAPAISFKSNRGAEASEANRYIQINLKSSVANATFYILIDGDTVTTINAVKANTLYDGGTSGNPNKITVTKPEVNVEIYGKTISFVNVNKAGAFDIKIGEDAKNTITEFRCESCPITSLDFINDMTAITYLYTTGNKKLTDVSIKNDVIQRVKLNSQPTIKNFSIEGAKIYDFNLTHNNGIETIDLSKCPVIKTVSLAQDSTVKSVILPEGAPSLTTFSLTLSQIESFPVKDYPALTSLSLTGNKKLSDIQISNCPKLKSLTISSNALKSFSLSSMPALTNLTITNNPLESLDLDLAALTSLYCNETSLKSVDLTKLPKVKNVYFKDGVLESIKLSDEALGSSLSGLYITNNNFALVDIPARGPKMKPSSSYSTPYNYYAPQKNPVLPTDITVGTSIDLSGYLYGKVYGTDSVVASEYKWLTKFDEELEAGVDYTVNNGVFTFLKAQEDSVACFVTNAEYPWFKKYTDTKGIEYDYRIKTNYISVNTVGGIADAVDNIPKVIVKSAAEKEITVSGAEGSEILVSDIAGRIVAVVKAADNAVVTVPSSGLYIVAVGNQRYKILVK